MVGFEARLAAESRPQWRESYLDYASLKRLIRDCWAALGATPQTTEGASPPTSTGGAATVVGPGGEAAKAAFQRKLDAEVLKVIAFYRGRLAELQQVVERATGAVHKLLTPHAGARSMQQAAALDRAAGVLQGAVQETTQLLHYIALNMTAIRKILKKYAKNVAGATQEPAPGFLALQVEHPDDPGWRVMQGTFLPARVAEDLQDMQQHVALRDAASRLQGLAAEVAEARASLLERASQRIPSLEEPPAGMVEQVEAMREAEEEAARHAALVHAMPWAERAAGMFEPPPPDAYAVATFGGLLINNLSTLLFMCNYTAVLPPTDALCVHIGVPSSYTGLIMAASDFAALFASVGISFWTQRSFREPLLFSAAMSLAGNLLFVLSYERRSLALLLLARLLNGLGSARVANRRYTADYVSRAKRTMASAAFVGASNLGMALGPLLSLPLAYLPEAELAGIPVNPITAVGFVMALLWLAFLAAAAVWFTDPPARTPIGLARSSLVTQSGAAASSSPATATGSLAGLHQPLLPARSSTLDSAGMQAAAEEAGRGLQLQDGASQASPHKSLKGAAAWRATLPGTVLCTLALFVQKMVQQSYMDSLPVITEVLYAWRATQKGLFLGLVSLAMVPVNAAVGAASALLSDRSMVLASLALSGLCSAALVWSAASPVLFFGAGVLLFVGTVVLEGTATSLMSKCIWRGFAQGVLNAGLLSTEAGTLGRFAGNALLALAGRLTGLEDGSQLAAFCAILYATLAASCAALLVHMVCIYGRVKG